MDVLILANAFPPVVGGAEKGVLSLARGLRVAGCSVRVVTATATADETITDLDVTRTPAALNIKVVKLLPLFLATLHLCLRRRPDYIVALSWTHEGVVARVVRALLGVDYAVAAHGTEILRHRAHPLHLAAMRRVFAGAAVIIANSRFTQSLLASCGIADSRVAVVYPGLEMPPEGVAPGDIDRRFGLAGRRVLITVARLVPRKGHAQVIELMRQVKDRYPDLTYVVTGTGAYLTELKALAVRLGVADRVVFVGRVTDGELAGLYRRADLYVSPSTEVNGDVEGFGLSFAEAGVHGLAVVAGRSGGVPEVVRDGETGILVTPGDRDELERAVVQLLDDEPRRLAMGRQARARLLTELRFDLQGARVRDVLVGHASPARAQQPALRIP